MNYQTCKHDWASGAILVSNGISLKMCRRCGLVKREK